MQYHQFRAMNTVVVLGVESESPLTAFQLAQDFIEQSERRFSRFLPESELNALNHSAGIWFSASPELMELMCAARDCYLKTQGLFNPAILPDLQAAGYTRTLPDLYLFGAGSKPESFSKHAALPFTDVELDLTHARIRLPAAMQIDLGGIAKGWVAQKAANLLETFSTACVVNAGGDMFLIGHPHEKNWEVVLEDPLNHSQDLLMLLVEDGAVATSSTTKRLWTQDKRVRHHLIDPRSGEPAESPWLSVTVFAPQAVQAETFAKALLIAGPHGAQTLLDENPHISFIAVDTEQQIWKSPTERERIHDYA